MRSIDSAKLANESMAELVQQHPDRFVGFAASMMLEDVDASLKEAERAIFEMDLDVTQVTFGWRLEFHLGVIPRREHIVAIIDVGRKLRTDLAR